MVLASFLLSAIAAVAVSSVAAQSVCQSSPYGSVACLTSDHAAAKICSSAPKQTTTLTVTTTTLHINTLSSSAHASSQLTINSTSTETSTKTITSGPMSTATSTYVKTNTENTTLTTYIPASSSANAPMSPQTDGWCRTSDAVAGLRSMSADTLATACSCIGKPVATRTVTTVITAAPVRTSTTEFAGTPSTTTLYDITLVTVTLTVAPTTTMTISTTTCTTSTMTESYQAPTFTHVYGPKPGCLDIAKAPAHALNGTITDVRKADEQCKELCAQRPRCSFVYVQHMRTNYGDAMPYFECSFNNHHLDARKDLRCGKDVGMYGVANGFDAYGRGTTEL